jgi:hypothetical protein
MNSHHSMTENLRQQAQEIFHAALRSVNPEEAILNHVTVTEGALREHLL